MKRGFLLCFIFAFVSTLLFGCGQVAQSNNQGQTGIGALTGTVKNLSGLAIAGATVSVGSLQVTTNGSGWFAAANLPAVRNINVTISAATYVTLRASAEVVGGQTRHNNYVLALANSAQSFSAASGGTISSSLTPGGSSLTATVSFPASALVNSSGAPYTGQANIAITNGDPTSSQEVRALFPGEFNALASTGTFVYLTSYGFANFNLTDSTGNALQLATGKTVQWQEEISSSQTVEAPSTIEMWYFDETANIWRQGVDVSGTPLQATKSFQGGKWYYTGNITHFSTWNFDVASPRALISGRVVNSSGEVIEGAQINCWNKGWRYSRWKSGESGTNAQGQFVEIPVEPGVAFQLQAVKDSQNSAYYSFGPFTANSINDLGDIVIPGGSSANIQIILTWGKDPEDLDTHLTTPSCTPESSSRGHIYYQSKGNASAFPYAWLDVDDISSYGPEITSVTRKLKGVYRYCVHNFSGQSSYPLESSRAKVEAFINGAYYSWTVPTTNPNSAINNVWQVFDLTIDASGKTSLSTLNVFSTTNNQNDPYNPAGAAGAFALPSEKPYNGGENGKFKRTL